VARRFAGTRSAESALDFTAPTKNGAPVREELSAIREGLHDLEHKLDRIELKIVQPDEPTRARLIDFVSSGPPLAGLANDQPGFIPFLKQLSRRPNFARHLRSLFRLLIALAPRLQQPIRTS